MPNYSPDPILAEAARKADNPPLPGKPHGVTVTGSQKPGYTSIYRHYGIGSGELLLTLDPKVGLRNFLLVAH